MTQDVLWTTAADRTASRLGRLVAQIEADTGQAFADPEEFRRWTVEHLDAYWLAVWRELDLPSDVEPSVALADDRMPGAVWFPEVRTNYAEAMLAAPGRGDDDVVVLSRSQSRDDRSWTLAQLRDDVASARAGLVRLGVAEGDRVAAYAPNIGETLVLLLATASLGAIFTSCAPEFGTQSVVDRLAQIEPSVVVAVDGYRYGTKAIDRRPEVEEVMAALPGSTRLVWLPYLAPDAAAPEGATTWAELLAEPGPLEFVRVPFDHPLYILYSSGTTGLPKAIVHGHGGITLVHGASLGLYADLGPTDRFLWFSTTGWMMWNYLVSGLLVGTTVVLFDGDPGSPDSTMLWRTAEELKLTFFGTSAPFLLQCRKEGVRPGDLADLSALRGLGSTGAPLPAEGFRWVYEAVGRDLQLGSISGGTDIAAAFLGTTPLTDVVAGELSCRLPGVALEAFDEQRRPVVGEVGELVVTRPFPSMPVSFWGDDDRARYRAAYFEDIPGVWRHGDWITVTERGTCIVTGRSDATLNRGGVRLGTSEFYSVVESLPEVSDSLVVHLEDADGGAGELVLFVAAAEADRQRLRTEIVGTLRRRLSPRHAPDTIHWVSRLPRTLSGKRLEVPVKRILLGTPVDTAVARGSLNDPDALDALVAVIGQRGGTTG